MIHENQQNSINGGPKMGKETCARLSSFHLIITIFQYPNATAVILYIPDEVQRLEFRTRRLRVSLLVIGPVYKAEGWGEEGGGKGKKRENVS